MAAKRGIEAVVCDAICHTPFEFGNGMQPQKKGGIPLPFQRGTGIPIETDNETRPRMGATSAAVSIIEKCQFSLEDDYRVTVIQFLCCSQNAEANKSNAIL